MTKRILFVCMNDLCLAPVMKVAMTDYCRQHRRYRNMVIESAGLLRSAVGMTANSLVCQEMHRRKHPIDFHRSRFVGNVDLSSFDRILFAAMRDYEMLENLTGSADNFFLLQSEDKTILPTTAYDDKDAIAMIAAVLRIVPQVIPQL